MNPIIIFLTLWTLVKSEPLVDISPEHPLIQVFMQRFVSHLGDKLEYVYDVSQVPPRIAAIIYYEINYRTELLMGQSDPHSVALIIADAIGATFGRLTPLTMAKAGSGGAAQKLLNTHQLSEGNVIPLATEYADAMLKSVEKYPYAVHFEALEEAYYKFSERYGLHMKGEAAIIEASIYASYFHYVVGDAYL